MSFPNKRDCEHGQLRRSCNLCEYEKEIEELKSQVVILKGLLGFSSKTPEQCLNDIKVDAINEAVKACKPGNVFQPDDPPYGLDHYCQALIDVQQYAKNLKGE